MENYKHALKDTLNYENATKENMQAYLVTKSFVSSHPTVGLSWNLNMLKKNWRCLDPMAQNQNKCGQHPHWNEYFQWVVHKSLK